MRRCEFRVMDAFDFLEKCNDSAQVGIYVDAPWPDAGERYTHRFDETQQRRLAVALERFTTARVVVRFGDHPLIRAIYPADRWTIRTVSGRNQSRNDTAELLLINGQSLVAGANLF